jgi:hypothetical protein
MPPLDNVNFHPSIKGDLEKFDHFVTSFFLDLRSLKIYLTKYFLQNPKLQTPQEITQIKSTFMSRIFHLVEIGNSLIEYQSQNPELNSKLKKLFEGNENHHLKKLLPIFMREIKILDDLMNNNSIDIKLIRMQVVKIEQLINKIIVQLNKVRQKEYNIYHLYHSADTFGDQTNVLESRNYLLHIAGGMGMYAGREGFKEFVKTINGTPNIRIFIQVNKKKYIYKINQIHKYIIKRENSGKFHHEFYIQILSSNHSGKKRSFTQNENKRSNDTQTYSGIFTNNEDEIADRQQWFAKHKDEGQHYTELDYVHGLRNIISKYNASLVFILCNLASAPDELNRLNDLTHSFVYIYDLPTGLFASLKSDLPVCFLSTYALFKLNTFQSGGKQRNMFVYEIDKPEPKFYLPKPYNLFDKYSNRSETLTPDQFYEAINDEIIGMVKINKQRKAKNNFIKFLRYVNFIKFPNIVGNKIQIVLGCTELPIARDNAFGENAMFFEDKKLNITYVFHDPLEIGNYNIYDLLLKKSIKEPTNDEIHHENVLLKK